MPSLEHFKNIWEYVIHFYNSTKLNSNSTSKMCNLNVTRFSKAYAFWNYLKEVALKAYQA